MTIRGKADQVYHACLRATQDGAPDLLKAGLELLRERMYLGQLGEVMSQGIRRARREEARLAHAAAKELPEAPGFGDVSFGAYKYRSNRRAEAFAEAQADGVEGGEQLLEGCLCLGGDVPYSGAV